MRYLLWLPFLLFIFLFTACSSDSDPEIRYSLSLTASPEEGGSVTPADAEFEQDRTVEISASSNEHWVFNGWEGDHEGTDNPTVITMDSDKDIAAIFTKRDYPLTININDEEGGTVTERIVQQKTTEYPHGTVVELTAEPNSGWEFIGWEGDLESAENPAEITVEGETEITALFERVEYPLTINIEGNGTVDEQVIEAKAKDYPFGTVVELTATAEENWIFDGWSGDLDGAESPVQITIDAEKEVTATFLRTFTLTTITEPEEGGEITPEAGDYVRDTNLEVEALPANEGWRFVSWEGDFTGGPSVNPFSLTMNGNKTIVANFERREFEIDITTEGEGAVTAELISGTETENGYLFESEVELTAEPTENWHFVGWEGDLEGEENPQTLIVDGSKSVTALFEPDESIIEFELEPSANFGSNTYCSVDEQAYAFTTSPDGFTIEGDNLDGLITQNGDYLFIPEGYEPGDYEFIYISKSLMVSILESPPADFEYEVSVFDEDFYEIQFTYSEPVTGLINWNINGEQISGETSPTVMVARNLDEIEATLIVGNDQGCQNSSSQIIVFDED